AVVFLSGLTAIPEELVAAARIDGGAGVALFRHITFPLLSPTTFFLLLVATIGAMTSFNLVYVMGGGGQTFGCAGNPLGTTQVAALYVFDRFWCQTQLGYASAAAFVLGLVVLAIAALNGRLFSRRVVYVGEGQTRVAVCPGDGGRRRHGLSVRLDAPDFGEERIGGDGVPAGTPSDPVAVLELRRRLARRAIRALFPEQRDHGARDDRAQPGDRGPCRVRARAHARSRQRPHLRRAPRDARHTARGDPHPELHRHAAARLVQHVPRAHRSVRCVGVQRVPAPPGLPAAAAGTLRRGRARALRASSVSLAVRGA